MEAHESEYEFPISETIQDGVVSHEEICEPNDDCILPESLARVVVDISAVMTQSEASVEIMAERSDDDDDKAIYPIYIKQEEQHNYTSGDDESMAVEALRQLGSGIYPSYETKKILCQRCDSIVEQSEFAEHREKCAIGKLRCPTCRESFERKQDLSNHMVCHQVDRPHACRTCGNLFRSKSHLQTHMSQIHRASKPHKCTICGSDFHRPSSLSNHMKIHTYVAGRALLQSATTGTIQSNPETLSEKWTEETANNAETTSYDVQWSVPYNFDPSVETITDTGDKIDGLAEFTVMPNGEVTHYEYPTQDPLAIVTADRYSTVDPDNLQSTEASNVKLESLSFAPADPRNYPEIRINDAAPKIHNCTDCGASFGRPAALASHAKIHATKLWSLPIECEYCDKQFQDSAHLTNHQTTCSRKLMRCSLVDGTANGKWGKHACGDCGKKFTTKQKMFRHQWIHRKKTHSCEICGVQFEKQNELDEHRLSEHPGDSPFTCAECGKCFVSRQGLWEHGRTHAGSPAHFHCDTCSKTFSSRQGYLIHHRTHTGERPYGCKFCWKAFRDGGTLRKHERIHTGERPHVCPICSRAFNQKVVLREHVRWVHAAGKNETEAVGPPYPCPICGSLNQDRDELCAHIVKHSDQMIAEAKARNNDGATKIAKGGGRKKSRISSSARSLEEVTGSTITRNEETEALLSIAENRDEEEMVGQSREIDERMLVIGDDREIEEMESSQDDRMNDRDIVITGSTPIITKIRQSDVLELMNNSKRQESLRIVATGGAAGNTLHLITKHNQSLPVLAIRNPQSHENFSSQMADVGETRESGDNDDMVDDSLRAECVINDETGHPNIAEVASYLREERESNDEENENEEMVCGICGDDFNDKNVLMEHVKIHI